MASVATNPVYFGSFIVTPQVFYRTVHSIALVNIKPLLPGHALVIPHRAVPRIKDLTPDEVTDLFLTVQKIVRVFEGVYKAHSFNIAIQDGLAAGQSVPHVHAHIIPRRFHDLPNSDDIYTLLESDAGDLTKNFRQHEALKVTGGPESANISDTNFTVDAKPEEAINITKSPLQGRAKFPIPLPDHLRVPRSEEDMRKEADMLAKHMEAYSDVD